MALHPIMQEALGGVWPGADPLASLNRRGLAMVSQPEPEPTVFDSLRRLALKLPIAAKLDLIEALVEDPWLRDGYVTDRFAPIIEDAREALRDADEPVVPDVWGRPSPISWGADR
jgi:hypothetical protein